MAHEERLPLVGEETNVRLTVKSSMDVLLKYSTLGDMVMVALLR
jgi:hypothetical protein